MHWHVASLHHFSWIVSFFFAGYQSPQLLSTYDSYPEPSSTVTLHQKLTSPLKRGHFKRNVIFLSFRGHVIFQAINPLHHGPPHPAVLEAVTNPMVYQSLKSGGLSFQGHSFNCSLYGSPLGSFTTSSRKCVKSHSSFTQIIGLLSCIWVSYMYFTNISSNGKQNNVCYTNRLMTQASKDYLVFRAMFNIEVTTELLVFGQYMCCMTYLGFQWPSAGSV